MGFLKKGALWDLAVPILQLVLATLAAKLARSQQNQASGKPEVDQ